jgi:hypothetical protein
MTLHPPRSRFLRFTIYLVCFILILLALDLLWVQSNRTIHPGYETTRIVAPLADDGSVNYLTAIETYFSRGVTRENNAAPLVLQALGRAALPTTQPPDGITDRLGMPHLPEQGDYFITYEAFTKENAEPGDPDLADNKRCYPWVKELSQQTRDWLKANETPLAKIEEATRRPRLWIPFNGGNHPQLILSVQIRHVWLIKATGSALLTRASARIESGDLDGCRADLLTVHRLARLIGQGPTLIERAVSMNMESEACRVDRAAAASGKLSSQQLRAWSVELTSMHDLAEPSECANVSERYMFLDVLQSLAHSNPSEAGRLWSAIAEYHGPPSWLYHFLPIPYENSMTVANHWHDGYLAAMRQSTYPQRHAALVTCQETAFDLARHSHFGPLSSTWGLSVFMPALDRIEQRWETSRAEARLTSAALALAAYKADRGIYPQTLADLLPEFLSELPIDNFTDRPLVYSRAEHGYTLYSVGPNMMDDGGASAAPADDIVASSK